MVFACFTIAGAIVFAGFMIFEVSKAAYTIAGVLDEVVKRYEDK